MDENPRVPKQNSGRKKASHERDGQVYGCRVCSDFDYEFLFILGRDPDDLSRVCIRNSVISVAGIHFANGYQRNAVGSRCKKGHV